MEKFLNLKILLTISWVLFFIFFGFSLVHVFYLGKNTFDKNILLFLGLMLIGNISIWIMLYNEKWRPSDKTLVLSDVVTSDRLVENIKQKFFGRERIEPEIIKMGFIINSIDVSQLGMVTFTGKIWQMHDEKIKDLDSSPIVITNASELDVKKMSTEKKQGKVISWWKIACTIDQYNSYKEYPFNDREIRIEFENKREVQDVILVPGLSEYAITRDNPYPWFEKDLKFKGFRVATSFFAYESYELKENEQANKIIDSKSINLRFYIVLHQDIVYSFFIYFLPLILIFVSIFAVLWLKTLHRITSYTSLAFVTILAHSSLRSSLRTSEIMYIEYFYFFAYLALLILVIDAIVSTIDSDISTYLQERASIYLKLFYWPVLLTLSFVTTAFVFYR